MMKNLFVKESKYHWYLFTESQIKDVHITPIRPAYCLYFSCRIKKLQEVSPDDFLDPHTRFVKDAYRYESTFPISFTKHELFTIRPIEEKDKGFLREALVYMWRTSEWAPLW